MTHETAERQDSHVDTLCAQHPEHAGAEQSLSTPEHGADALGDPDAGWEVRVALDRAYRRFLLGLRERPTHKPMLFFLPQGASPLLASTMLELRPYKQAVLLVEDPVVAMQFDERRAPGSDYQVVLGTLETLAKTDADQYGSCVILAYGQNVHRHGSPYLYRRIHLVARLCGWSAHLLYCEAPFSRHEPDFFDELAQAHERAAAPPADKPVANSSPRKVTCGCRDRNHRLAHAHAKPRAVKPRPEASSSPGQSDAPPITWREDFLNSILCNASDGIREGFHKASRRASVVLSTGAGLSSSTAICCYAQILRTSGSKNKVPPVRTIVAPDEHMAALFYRDAQCTQGCPDRREKCEHVRPAFMSVETYLSWVARAAETETIQATKEEQ